MATRVYYYAGREWRDPRGTWAWRKLRDRVIDEEPTCRLRISDVCTLVSTTAAHIIPVVERPDLAMERSNLEGACRECNEATGTMPRHAIVIGGDDGDQSDALSIFRRC